MNEFLMELGLPDGVQLDTVSGNIDAYRQNGFDPEIQDGVALVRWLTDTGNRIEFAKTNVESLTLLPYWNTGDKMAALSGEVIYAKGLRNTSDSTVVTVIAHDGAIYYVSPAELQPNEDAAAAMIALTENRGDATDLKVEYLVRKGVKPDETGLGLLLSTTAQDAPMWQGENLLGIFMQSNRISPKWLMKELSYKDIPNILSSNWFYNGTDRNKPGNDEKFLVVFLDDDGITKLTEAEKLLFAVSADGGWLVSFQLSDALKGAIDNGNGGNGGSTPPPTRNPEPIQALKLSEPIVETATEATVPKPVASTAPEPAIAAADATPIQRLQNGDIYKALTRDQRLDTYQALVNQMATDAGCRTYTIKVVPDSQLSALLLGLTSFPDQAIIIRESYFAASANSADDRWALVNTIIHEATHMVQAEYVINGSGNGSFLDQTDLYGTDLDAAIVQLRQDMKSPTPTDASDLDALRAYRDKLNEKTVTATARRFVERHRPK